MNKKRTIIWIEGLLLFSIQAAIFLFQIKSVPFHVDESQWISTSSVFEAVTHGDFTSSIWDLSFWNMTQPQLPRYIIGVGRWLGGEDGAALNTPWVWRENVANNEAKGRMPTPYMLWWSRMPMAVLAAAAFLLTFLLLKRFMGRALAYIWLILINFSSYYSTNLLRAMGEATLLVCIIGVLVIAFHLLRAADEKPNKIYLYILIFGIVSGLAESAKLNGASVLAAGVILLFVIAFRSTQSKTLKIRSGLISMFILAFSSQGIFELLNPFLWKSPLTYWLLMFYDRVHEMQLQQGIFPNFIIHGFFRHITVDSQRIFQTFASLHFTGALWVNLGLFLAGITFLIMKSVQYLRRQHNQPAALALLVVGGAAAIPSLFTPLDWERYYLLPAFFSTIAIAIGIWLLGSYGYGLIQRRLRVPNSKIALLLSKRG